VQLHDPWLLLVLAAIPLLACLAAWMPDAKMPAWHRILAMLAPNPEIAVAAIVVSGLMFVVSVALWISVNARWREIRNTNR
jgi:hypothetical protein